MSRSSIADSQLNVLAVRGTGFPEECLHAFADKQLLLTQAPDTFAARAAQGSPSCIAVGPAWPVEARYLQQVLQQSPEGSVLLCPEGDVKLAHLAGLAHFGALETYSEAADWTLILNQVHAAWEAGASQPPQSLEGGTQPSIDARGQRKQVVFSDPTSKAMLALVQRVAQVDVTALLSGPSGVGKEVVAQILHNASNRSSGPFIALNCSAMPEHLVESILFGHVKGSFTGAIKDQPGIFEDANQGTLFLDEVGELPLHVQPKLLRVIQERKAARIGSTRELSFDVRLVAATNRDLVDLVARGQFREDLLYRLNAFHIGIPRLRDRPGDIDQLAIAFAESDQIAGVAMKIREDAIHQLRLHDWPGNVRELDNVICRAKVLATDGVIGAEHIFFDALKIDTQPSVGREGSAGASPFAQVAPDAGNPVDQDLMSVKERAEWQLIRAALEETDSKKEAAERLGISPRTLRHKLQKWKASEEEVYQSAGNS